MLSRCSESAFVQRNGLDAAMRSTRQAKDLRRRQAAPHAVFYAATTFQLVNIPGRRESARSQQKRYLWCGRLSRRHSASPREGAPCSTDADADTDDRHRGRCSTPSHRLHTGLLCGETPRPPALPYSHQIQNQADILSPSFVHGLVLIPLSHTPHLKPRSQASKTPHPTFRSPVVCHSQTFVPTRLTCKNRTACSTSSPSACPTLH